MSAFWGNKENLFHQICNKIKKYEKLLNRLEKEVATKISKDQQMSQYVDALNKCYDIYHICAQELFQDLESLDLDGISIIFKRIIDGYYIHLKAFLKFGFENIRTLVIQSQNDQGGQGAGGGASQVLNSKVKPLNFIPSISDLKIKRDPFGKEKSAKKKALEMFKNQERDEKDPIDRLMDKDQDEEDDLNSMIDKVLGEKEAMIDKLGYSGAGKSLKAVLLAFANKRGMNVNGGEIDEEMDDDMLEMILNKQKKNLKKSLLTGGSNWGEAQFGVQHIGTQYDPTMDPYYNMSADALKDKLREQERSFKELNRQFTQYKMNLLEERIKDGGDPIFLQLKNDLHMLERENQDLQDQITLKDQEIFLLKQVMRKHGLENEIKNIENIMKKEKAALQQKREQERQKQQQQQGGVAGSGPGGISSYSKGGGLMNNKEMRQEMDYLQERCEFLEEMFRLCKEQHGGVKITEEMRAKYSDAVIAGDRQRFKEEQDRGIESQFQKNKKKEEMLKQQMNSDGKNNQKGSAFGDDKDNKLSKKGGKGQGGSGAYDNDPSNPNQKNKKGGQGGSTGGQGNSGIPYYPGQRILYDKDGNPIDLANAKPGQVYYDEFGNIVKPTEQEINQAIINQSMAAAAMGGGKGAPPLLTKQQIEQLQRQTDLVSKEDMKKFMENEFKNMTEEQKEMFRNMDSEEQQIFVGMTKEEREMFSKMNKEEQQKFLEKKKKELIQKKVLENLTAEEREKYEKMTEEEKKQFLEQKVKQFEEKRQQIKEVLKQQEKLMQQAASKNFSKQDLEKFNNLTLEEKQKLMELPPDLQKQYLDMTKEEREKFMKMSKEEQKKFLQKKQEKKLQELKNNMTQDQKKKFEKLSKQDQIKFSMMSEEQQAKFLAMSEDEQKKFLAMDAEQQERFMKMTKEEQKAFMEMTADQQQQFLKMNAEQQKQILGMSKEDRQKFLQSLDDLYDDAKNILTEDQILKMYLEKKYIDLKHFQGIKDWILQYLLENHISSGIPPQKEGDPNYQKQKNRDFSQPANKKKYIPEGKDEKGAYIMRNGKKVYLKEDGTIDDESEKLPPIGGQNRQRVRHGDDDDQQLIDPDNETEQQKEKRLSSMYDSLLAQFGDKEALKRNPQLARILQQMSKLFGKEFNADNLPSLEEFKNFVLKLENVHNKCGKNCSHLRRFFERIGWNWRRYYATRKLFPIHRSILDEEIEDDERLPELQNNYKKESLMLSQSQILQKKVNTEVEPNSPNFRIRMSKNMNQYQNNGSISKSLQNLPLQKNSIIQ